jgi:hypothetical protein
MPEMDAAFVTSGGNGGARRLRRGGSNCDRIDRKQATA